MKKQPQIVYLKDYQPPAYLIPNINLQFDLHEDEAIVISTMSVERAPKTLPKTPFVLDGEDLELIDIKLNGTPLDKDGYELTKDSLTILKPLALTTELQIITRIFPQKK